MRSTRFALKEFDVKRYISFLNLLLFFSAVSFGFDESSGHFIEALPKKNRGEKLYMRYCASCHHPDRIGLEGPPLYAATLRRYKTLDMLVRAIRNGFPQTLMPTFEQLDRLVLIDIARYIKQPLSKDIVWGKKEIVQSLRINHKEGKNLGNIDLPQITPVVERGADLVWIMQDDAIKDRFKVRNVHGGMKYRFPDAMEIFIPSRDGWVTKYSLRAGKVTAQSRACINLRNLSLDREGNYLFVTCLLPRQLVIYDAQNMDVVRIDKLEGKVSALYERYTKDEAIFTYRDRSEVLFIDTQTLKMRKVRIDDEPIEDFFIDPFDEYIVATSRGGNVLRVYEIETMKKVFEAPMKGMPHLFSATYFYKDGAFYFATPHLRSSYVTVWRMYDWAFEKKIDIGGDGFFAKTHPATPYLWIDNGSDELVLVSKKDFSIMRKKPIKQKRFIHTEFSGDGKYAYLSIYDKNGSLEVWDTTTLQPLRHYKANVPVGKYNFICKNRRFYPMLFGMEMAINACNGDMECLKRLKPDSSYARRAKKAYIRYMQEGI
jgi:hypothetical protein